MIKKTSIKLFTASVLMAFSFSLTIGAKVLAEKPSSCPDCRVKMHEKFEKKHGFIEGFTNEQIGIVKASMLENMKIAMGALVSKEVITKEQSDKILAHDREVFKSLSVEQKQAVRTAIEKVRKDTLDKLAKDGKITKAQADQLSKGKESNRKE